MAGMPKSKNIVAHPVDALLCEELLQGLCAENKNINPKFFYNERGSELFEQIMSLQEYYPTRTELSLLQRYSAEIAVIIGEGHVLLEPGAGNCAKVRTLLPFIKPSCYMPIDISGEFLFACAKELQQAYPQVDVHPVAGDMSAEFVIPAAYQHMRKTVFYPGSTISNYTPDAALKFLRHIASQLDKDGGLLIGVDLQKDVNVLHRAYNDVKGVTALFNLNILNHCNQLLGSDFDVSLFEHIAFYNEQECRIEMHLESQVDQQLNVAGENITFSAGERIHTEYSYKYTLESFAAMAKEAGLKAQKQWVDDDSWFSLQYFTVA